MKITFILIFILGQLFNFTANATKILDFKFGLVCPDKENKSAWICHETKEIKITGQGVCTFNKKRGPCTWYGVSFNYTEHNINEKIKCIGKSPIPFTLGNPDGKDKASSREHKYSLELKGRNGAYINPQYTTYSTKNLKNHIQKYSTECFIGNKLAYKYEYSIIYPIK